MTTADTGPQLAELVDRLLAGPRPLPIVTVGDPVLRAGTADYDWSLPESRWQELIGAMREAMSAAPGVGLAGPQVGLPLRMAVIEDPATIDPRIAAARGRTPVPFRVIVNPRYAADGTGVAAFYEGCLSVPGLQAVVARADRIRLRGQDAAGEPLDELVSGWPARIVAHETDHLDGTVYLDRAELRSLTDTAHYLTRWSHPRPTEAAAGLGFELPEPS